MSEATPEIETLKLTEAQLANRKEWNQYWENVVLLNLRKNIPVSLKVFRE